MTPEQSLRGVLGMMQGVTCPLCREHVEWLDDTRECDCGEMGCKPCIEQHAQQERHQVLPNDWGVTEAQS